MKKLILFVLTALILAACVNDDEALEAKVSDFEGSGFTNTKHQIIAIIEDEGIMVSSGMGPITEKKSSLDIVLEKENVESGNSFFKIYPQGKIETKGSKYYVTLDKSITLEFEKIALRKIKDSEGVEYVTQKYPE